MVSGIGPLASVDYVPLAGCSPAGGRGVSLACAGGLEGGRATVSPLVPQPTENLPDPACIVNSGQKLKTPKIILEGSVLMVGSGDECEPGGWVTTAVCPKCGHHVSLVKHGCGLISCPSCAHKWARRAAERSAARLWGAIHAGVSKWKPRHITFDLEECSWDEAKKRALEIGCTGGVLVIHPWRLKAEYKQMFELMAERTGKNRYDLAKESAYGMDAFEWSPHCHGMVFGKFQDVQKNSGVFEYRNIRRLNSQHAAEGSLMYLFGHTFQPLSKNGKCYRYFGICSPQKLKPGWTGTCTDSLKCPCCEAEMVEEGTINLILYKRYIALGWRKTTKPPGGTKIKIPHKAPCACCHAPEPFAQWA